MPNPEVLQPKVAGPEDVTELQSKLRQVEDTIIDGIGKKGANIDRVHVQSILLGTFERLEKQAAQDGQQLTVEEFLSQIEAGSD